MINKYKMSVPKVILIDLDGVLVKGPTKEHEEELRSKKELRSKIIKDGLDSDIHWSDIPDIFLDLEPMEGAIDAFNKLSENYEVFIVSTAPWNNPSAWTDKRLWVEKHLPNAAKRLFLTHRKDMVIGDYLIDDRLKNGVDKFSGKHIHFGQSPFETWDKVIDYFLLINNQ